MIVGQSPAGEDFSAVVSAFFEVRRPDGTETTWTASILAQSVTSITLQHTFAAGDVDQVGTYVVKASMNNGVSGGIRSEPAELKSLGKFQVKP